MTVGVPVSLAPAETNVFAQLLALGYPGVVCVIPPGAALKPDIPNFSGASRSRGKCPGVLTATGWAPYNYRTRPFDPETDPARFHAWGGSAGLRLTDDLVAIDMDCRNKDLSNAIARKVRERIGPAPARVGLAPKALFLVRIAREDLERVRYRALHFDDGTDKRAGLEILAQDRQCVVAGPYGIDGEPAGFDYRWPEARIPAYDLLPIVRWSAIEALLSDCAEFLPKADRPGRASLAIVRTEVEQAGLKASGAHVARLVASIPNRRRYDAMIEMAAAIRGAAQDHDDEGLSAFLEWCARWEDGEADLAYCERIFESLEPPFGLGVQRLEYLAGHGAPGAEGTGRVEADPTRYLGAVDEADVDAAVALFPALPAGGMSMADDEPRPQLRPMDLSRLDEFDPPEKLFYVAGMVPHGEVTMLTGEGGVGKSLLALQMLVAVALGLPFLGRETKAAKCFALFCEDDEHIIHARLKQICKHYDVPIAALSGRLCICPSKYIDNYLMVHQRQSGVMALTPLFREIVETARAFGAEVNLLDTIADIYGGEEIVRQQVRQFVQGCAGALAAATGGATIILGHPSRAGATTDGTSGSTAWHGSVRSRLWLKFKDDEMPTGPRLLSVPKQNYGPAGGVMTLEYQEGAFAVTLDAGSAAQSVSIAAQQVMPVVLAALAAANEAGLRVAPGKTTKDRAAVVLRQMDNVSWHGITDAEIERAVADLLRLKMIEDVVVGRGASRHALRGLRVMREDNQSLGLFD